MIAFLRRARCWLFGHQWNTDFQKFASDGPCVLSCSRCPAKVDCAPWRKMAIPNGTTIRPGFDPTKPPEDLTTCSALELWVLWWSAHQPGALWISVQKELRRRLEVAHKGGLFEGNESEVLALLETTGRLIDEKWNVRPGPPSPPPKAP